MRAAIPLTHILVLSTLILATGCGPAAAPPHNIVLILADDMGYETVGSNGGLSYETPRLDALAREGVRFTQAYATPLCTPSRVQLMTGKYGFRNYVGFGILDPGETTFAHLLRSAGYATAVAGKWQLYGTPGQHELAGRTGTLPEEAGFDESLVWQVRTVGSRYRAPVLSANGDSAVVHAGAYGPDLLADFIDEFVSRHADRPFFLYYPMVLPHAPYQPTPLDPDYGSDPGPSDTAYFGSYIRYVDRQVGRVVDALDRHGVRDRTLLLFVGDNGTGRGVESRTVDGTVRGHKAFPDAAGTHVPLIASLPDVARSGTVSEALVDLSDFLPTMIDAAGSRIPTGFETDGLSFWGQLTGRPDSVRSWTFTHYAPNWGGFEHRRWAHDGTWKVYGNGEIYHVAGDPLETKPVVRDTLSREAADAVRLLENVINRMH